MFGLLVYLGMSYLLVGMLVSLIWSTNTLLDGKDKVILILTFIISPLIIPLLILLFLISL